MNVVHSALNVGLLLHQAINHTPQTGEGLVDPNGLLQVRPLHLGLGDLLGSGQVNQIGTRAARTGDLLVAHLRRKQKREEEEGGKKNTSQSGTPAPKSST